MNYGVLTGKKHNLIVVDLDLSKVSNELSGIDWYNKLDNNKQEELNQTLVCQTGSGGYHFYYRPTNECDKITNMVKVNGYSVDIKYNGGQVVGPESTHPNGRKYEIITDNDIQIIPKWLVEWILSNNKKIITIIPKSIKHTEEQIDIILNIANEFPQIVEAFNFEKQHGDNMWLYKRKKPSYCEKCEKTHDRLDGYVFTRYDKDTNKTKVIFNCRHGNADQVIGLLDSHSNDDENVTDDYWKHLHCMTLQDDYYFQDWVEEPTQEALIKNISRVVRPFENRYLVKCDSSIKVWSKTDVYQKFSKYIFKDEGKKRFTAYDWLISVKTEQLLSIRREIFDPDGNNNLKILNHWHGFGFTFLKKDEINMDLVTPIIQHFRDVYFSSDKYDSEDERAAAEDFFMRYLANIFIKPGSKSAGHAVVITGKMGAGKGIILEWIIKNLNYRSDLELATQLTVDAIRNKFNSFIDRKLLILIDESENIVQSDMATIKMLTTQASISIERKGKDRYTTNCYARLFFVSNEPDAMIISQDDRRFLIIDADSKHVKNSTYFANLVAILEHKDTWKHFVSYLFNSYDGTIPMNIPVTKPKQRMINASKQSWELFFESVDWNQYSELIPTSELYNSYKEFCIKKDIQCISSVGRNCFGSRMKALGLKSSKKTLENAWINPVIENK